MTREDIENNFRILQEHINEKADADHDHDEYVTESEMHSYVNSAFSHSSGGGHF